MEHRTTDELMAKLKSIQDEEKLLRELSGWEQDTQKPLHELLAASMEARGLTKSHVVERSGLNRVYGYEILSGKKKPGRDKLLALCIAVGVTHEECQKVLQAADLGALYVRSRRDAIVVYALQNSLSVVEANTMLYECGEAILE